jgi:excisionase family DNA binding protein
VSALDLHLRHPDAWPAFLTVEEAACILRLGRSAAYEAVASGALPTVRFGGRSLRVPRGALARLAGEQLLSSGAEQAADQEESAGGGMPRHATEQP